MKGEDYPCPDSKHIIFKFQHCGQHEELNISYSLGAMLECSGAKGAKLFAHRLLQQKIARLFVM